MGFFDKLKSAANAVTGGAATVTVSTLGDAKRGERVHYVVEANAKAACKVDGVYLMVRCREEADVQDRDYEDGKVQRELVRGRKTAWETRVDVAGACELAEGTGQAWQSSFDLPADALPSVQGQMVRVVWEMQAGLDMWGNDPDSGWVRFEVR
jgi:hypothetical protein